MVIFNNELLLYYFWPCTLRAFSTIAFVMIADLLDNVKE
jgi:hypothetical protein